MKRNVNGWFGIAFLGVLLGGAVISGVVPRLEERKALARSEKIANAPRKVRVAAVRASDGTWTITLPGTSAPFHFSALYAKSTGFVRRNLVDVGDHVKAGQLLAEIDAPETTEDIRLAQAQLNEAQANIGIAQSTAERAKHLAVAGVGTEQQSDDAKALANSAFAAVQTRKAELQRLNVLRGYQAIVAPFDGIITRRGTDPGALVGTASAGSAALFEVSAVDVVRISVDIPDAYAADVTPGVDAKVFVPRDPAHKVVGKVARTSGVLEQASRTLRAEVDIPGVGAPLPGAFVYVELTSKRAHPAPIAPASALIVRKEGTLVARVAPDGRLAVVPVVLGRDFGKELEILDGLSVGDQVVVNAPSELETGEHVEVVR